MNGCFIWHCWLQAFKTQHISERVQRFIPHVRTCTHKSTHMHAHRHAPTHARTHTRIRSMHQTHTLSPCLKYTCSYTCTLPCHSLHVQHRLLRNYRTRSQSRHPIMQPEDIFTAITSIYSVKMFRFHQIPRNSRRFPKSLCQRSLRYSHCL